MVDFNKNQLVNKTRWRIGILSGLSSARYLLVEKRFANRPGNGAWGARGGGLGHGGGRFCGRWREMLNVERLAAKLYLRAKCN